MSDVHKGIYAIFSRNLTTGRTETLVSASPGGASRPELSHDQRTLAFVRRVRDKEALVLKYVLHTEATTRDVRSRDMWSCDPRFWKLPRWHRAPKAHHDYLRSTVPWYVSRCTIASYPSASSNGGSLSHERRNPTGAGRFLG